MGYVDKQKIETVNFNKDVNDTVQLRLFVLCERLALKPKGNQRWLELLAGLFGENNVTNS